MRQCLRIIGGKYRGKKLHFPEAEGLRPTPNRIRETLFNWLMHDIHGARCLDAFAGSGALGFEAWSRGAAEVVFVEQAPAVFAHLKHSASLFHSPFLSVIKDDANHYFHHNKKSFDIIFLDPPFAEHKLPEYLSFLSQSTLLSLGGLIYVESDQEIAADPIRWQNIKLKRAGKVIYGLYRKLGEDN